MKLNIGCGRKHLAGAVNLDVSADVGADVVHDLNRFPWPFEDGTFDEIYAYDVLEHVVDLPPVLEEIHRIAKPGGVLCVTVPHFSSANAFTDLTHRHFFGWRSFDPYEPGDKFDFYSRTARFRRRHTRISFYRSIVNRIVFRLANRWPDRYEQRWAWMFPAWFIYYELEVLK